MQPSEPAQDTVVAVLLDRYGRTFAEELGIAVEQNAPEPLFRLLCAALLFSARIGARIAVRAAQALSEQGWTTPEAMLGATWAERTRVLNQSGYARYDERTSRMLADTSQLLLDRYAGDLRNLRQAAERDPRRERALLKAFKGIGDVGVDIFFREVQVAWDELFPFADPRALAAARRLGLPGSAPALVDLAGAGAFPRLVAALVRVELAGTHEGVMAEARRLGG